MNFMNSGLNNEREMIFLIKILDLWILTNRDSVWQTDLRKDRDVNIILCDVWDVKNERIEESCADWFVNITLKL